jgi:hypothetical protein
MLLASGTIQKADLIRSLYAYRTLTNLVALNGTEFLEKPLPELFLALDDAMAPIIDKYVPKTIINIDEPSVDPEFQRTQAEAQANLKGSVGGVQGILQIQQSVANGITDYSAAISLLGVIYGIEEQTARQILGTPKTISPETTV